jgi:hypothetical protein
MAQVKKSRTFFFLSILVFAWCGGVYMCIKYAYIYIYMRYIHYYYYDIYTHLPHHHLPPTYHTSPPPPPSSSSSSKHYLCMSITHISLTKSFEKRTHQTKKKHKYYSESTKNEHKRSRCLGSVLQYKIR